MVREIEKRKYTRLSAYHLVKYRLDSWPKEKAPLLASAKDIGGGGVRLITQEAIAIGSILHLWINFPNSAQPVSAAAKVIWTMKLGKTNNYETGLEFTEIDEDLRKHIISRSDSIKEKLDKLDEERQQR